MLSPHIVLNQISNAGLSTCYIDAVLQMKILCTFEKFRVAVNNIALFEFTHRVRELNQIDRINILHDVVLTYVNVETLP